MDLSKQITFHINDYIKKHKNKITFLFSISLIDYYTVTTFEMNNKSDDLREASIKKMIANNIRQHKQKKKPQRPRCVECTAL